MKSLIVLSALVAGFMTVNANAQTCRSGEEAVWEVQDGSESGTRTIFVCRNGQFVPKFGKAPEYIRNPRNTCREGSVERFSTNNGGESDVWELFQCRGGRFVPMYRAEPEYIRNPRSTCREGQREMWLDNNESGEGSSQHLYVCHNGRFERAYR
jgi:hypothetical protein